MTNLVLESLAISAAVNGLMFLIAFRFKSDKLTDASYALTFLILAVFALAHAKGSAAYNMVAFGLVAVWAVRTGGFLLYRVIKKGKDGRFDEMREHFWQFGKFWAGQALTVWVLMIPVTLGITHRTSWHSVALVGAAVWLLGWIIETTADYQKARFSGNPSNKGKWIDEGIWSYSRHPNYFGEILIWVGLYAYLFAELSATNRLISLVSPLFIIVLLRFVSGVPILEKSADKKWGDDPRYQAYKKRTSLLILLPPDK